MTGSEKQVKWAEQIITEKLERASQLPSPEREIVTDFMNAVEDASYIIRHKGDSLSVFIDSIKHGNNRPMWVAMDIPLRERVNSLDLSILDFLKQESVDMLG